MAPFAPLILAPLAGGPCTPELVAAVCNHGGLGSIGAAYMNADEIERFVGKVRQLTDSPFAINLFIPHEMPPLDEDHFKRAQHATAVFRSELKIPQPKLKPPYAEDFEEQFSMILKLKPAFLSFVFGRLAPDYRRACQALGIKLIGTATSLDEARQLQADAVDAIVLQGREAGGHRGIFDATAADPDIGTFELLQSVRDEISLPLISAGGIMDAEDMAKVLAAGASAAQLGTAFLLCEEAGTSEPYRRALVQGGPTRLTRAFSGRLARGLVNRFMETIDQQPDSILPFPIQNAWTRDLRRACADKGWPDFLSLWAGTGIRHIRQAKAGELTAALLNEVARRAR